MSPGLNHRHSVKLFIQRKTHHYKGFLYCKGYNLVGSCIESAGISMSSKNPMDTEVHKKEHLGNTGKLCTALKRVSECNLYLYEKAFIYVTYKMSNKMLLFYAY